MRGWRAVSATGLQGKGLRQNSVCFTDAGIRSQTPANKKNYKPHTSSLVLQSSRVGPRPHMKIICCLARGVAFYISDNPRPSDIDYPRGPPS